MRVCQVSAVGAPRERGDQRLAQQVLAQVGGSHAQAGVGAIGRSSSVVASAWRRSAPVGSIT